MTFSYSGNPASSSVDAARFLIGDTDPNNVLLQNEEIYFLLLEFPQNVYYGAAACCEVIASKFAIEVSYQADGVDVGVNELQEKFIQQAVELRTLGKRKGRVAAMWVGGALQSEVDEFNNDDEFVPLFAGVGMNDNPRAGRQDYPSSKSTPNELTNADVFGGDLDEPLPGQ